jgi:geranylgeranyl diphosphate synthase type II
MGLSRYLKTAKDRIDIALDAYLPAADKTPRTLHRAMRYCVFPGGKRIRPIIVLASAQACGIKYKKALPAACAVELIHSYSLVHDDLPSMDNDNYRRGRPACHRAFGEASAILAGDGLLTLAFNIIAKRMSPVISVLVARELSDAVGTLGMVGGQAADIEFRDKEKSRKITTRINRLKTARLFEASSKLGAIAAMSGTYRVKAMSDYGANLGAAFQIVDDIIDGDETVKLSDGKQARGDAISHIEKAKVALEPFGTKGNVLRALADSVLEQI